MKTTISKLIDIIKQHIELRETIHMKERELNADLYNKKTVTIPCLADFKTSPEIKQLYKKDFDLFSDLSYEEAVQIEAAMLVGRELFYKKENGHAFYDEELSTINLLNLKEWAKIFELPPAACGRLKAAISYTVEKNIEFLKAYIDEIEKANLKPTKDQYNALEWQQLEPDSLPKLLEEAAIISADICTDGVTAIGADLFISKDGKQLAVYIGLDPFENNQLLIEYAESGV